MSSPPVPAEDADRQVVLSELATRPVPASLRPQSLIAPAPLRPLPAKVAGKIEARVRAGLDPTGADHPRRETWQLTTVPALTGVVSGVTAIVAELISHHLLALIAAIVFAVSVVGGIALSAWVMADPLRIRSDERRAITEAHFWQSRQQWLGQLHDAPERALVGFAADLITQIAASPAWSSSYLDAHRSRLDLIAELDQIDAQAHQCAAARVARPNDPSAHATYLALVDRVAAVRRYAQALDALGVQLSAAAASVDAELHGGQYAGAAIAGPPDAVGQLTSELAYMKSSLEQQIALTQSPVTGKD